ncbi:MAG: phosphatase PAP2 family protein [Clostridia bacterium]|nr:phosphatase PAP2 family protein [Clostridia bacterium]
MKKKYLYISIFSLAAFVLWTLLLRLVDVRAIGPEGSSVGFSALNGFIHEKIGVNMYLYNITDWLGLVPIGVAFGFAILGLIQLIKRKSLLRVDRSILGLGVFYIIVVAVYLFFEIVVINYRPVLIEGCLEASYPSSTTMLVTCVIPSAAMQAKERIKNKALRQGVIIIIIAFIAFMVVARLLSGVHWITDIIGGALFSLGVVMAYKSFLQK